ncbi:MAG: glycoside hydrolase family 6 protein, partial [Fibrobacterales bacterium]
SNGEWCNPRGRALGENPRAIFEGALDGYLWVKRPGESDGTCNSGPTAGHWWLEYALELARNR